MLEYHVNIASNISIIMTQGTIAIHFNLLQVCPSLAHFVLAVLFIFSFHVLTVYVYLSLSLMAVNYHCLKFVKS